jgi:putative flippase GtrA
MKEKLKAAFLQARVYITSSKGEAARYVLIGGCTTLLDYITYYLMANIFGIGVTISNVVSTILAVLFAYITNKLLVFQSRTATAGALAGEFLRFIGARLATMGIEIGGVYLLVNIIGQDKLAGKAETIIVVIAVNYFLSKFLVFRRKRQAEENPG